MQTFETGKGVILKLNPVSPYLINDRMRKFRGKPKPPKLMIEEKGRVQENPNDPAYLEEVERWDDERQDAIMDIVIGVGTELLKAPEDFPLPDSEGWAERIQAITGIDIPKDGFFRYIAWVKYQAIAGAMDLDLFNAALREIAGTPEQAVADAAESFPSEQVGPANRATRRRAARENRDPV